MRRLKHSLRRHFEACAVRCAHPLQVSVPDDELERVDQLPGLWAEFVAALDGVPARLRQLAG